MNSGSVKFSVVLSTYNRGSMLGDAIQSLLLLDPSSPRHEIIIVDNNSTDHTRELVESIIPSANGRLSYVFEPRQGLSYGRNAGIAASRGAIIAFTDDDVRVSPNWLVTLEETFKRYADIAYIGGKVLPIWPGPLPSWFHYASHSASLALCDHGDKVRDITPENFVCMVGANLAIRRHVFETIGAFDPRFQHLPGARSATEDHDFQIRMQRRGYRGLYQPEAIINAEVQAYRLRKRHHRRWHFDHGRAMVRMTPPGTYLDGVEYTPLAKSDKFVRGIPVKTLREAAYFVREAAKHAVRRDFDQYYQSIGQVFERAGAAFYYATTRRRGLDANLHDSAPPRA